MPIPILLELTGSQLQQKVYINVTPHHFINAASANQVEGELRVLGSVAQLVGGDGDGFVSAEQWLLHDWEYLMRRQLMTQIGDLVRDMVNKLSLDLPTGDVHAFIKGPAVVINAIALY